MADANFDTLSYARRMEQAGFTRQQAEALALEQARLIDDRLATKADIADIRRDIESMRSDLTRDMAVLRSDLTRDIEALRQETKKDIELLRRDLTIRLGGIVIAAVAAGSTVVTLLSRLPAFHP